MMKILFIHQNFPGQFKYLAPACVQAGYDVSAMSLHVPQDASLDGINLHTYILGRSTSLEIHPWVSDFETKVIRAEACYSKCLQLSEQGYSPDLVIAHPGWGESLFVKEVWPYTRLALYCEFFYHAEGADIGFDPEFSSKDPWVAPKIVMKNVNNILHSKMLDAAISPTHWQASTFPAEFKQKMTVIHDGIDTQFIKPNPSVSLTLNDRLTLTKQDEIITFVNRNLEPYRGYHIFMRALPRLLKERPNARFLLVGGDGVSYGGRPENGQNWKAIYINEVRHMISDSDWSRVHFLGNIDYSVFIGLLQLSTIHVYLTYPFVLSWSLIEAMSAGCAIVASDTQPLHEVIQHDQNGRLVDFFDVEGLIKEIVSLLDDPDTRQRLGSAARTHAIEHYDLKSVCLPRQIAWVRSLLAA